MGEDREGHPVWYDNFNYDFKGTCMKLHLYTLNYSLFLVV